MNSHLRFDPVLVSQVASRIAAGRAEIARERAAAAKVVSDTAAQIESLILGTTNRE